MLQLGNGPRTHDENRAHFTMWAMLADPLMLGTIVTNDEVIAIDQDPLAGKPGVCEMRTTWRCGPDRSKTAQSRALS